MTPPECPLFGEEEKSTIKIEASQCVGAQTIGVFLDHSSIRWRNLEQSMDGLTTGLGNAAKPGNFCLLFI